MKGLFGEGNTRATVTKRLRTASWEVLFLGTVISTAGQDILRWWQNYFYRIGEPESRASENCVMQGRGEDQLFMFSLDQRIKGWVVPILEAWHTEIQLLCGAVAEDNSSTSRCILRSSAPWKKEPCSNKSFPTIVSFLERHFPQVLKRKKTFLHMIEFRLDHFCSLPTLSHK